jgi:hypothetical protein
MNPEEDPPAVDLEDLRSETDPGMLTAAYLCVSIDPTSDLDFGVFPLGEVVIETASDFLPAR